MIVQWPSTTTVIAAARRKSTTRLRLAGVAASTFSARLWRVLVIGSPSPCRSAAMPLDVATIYLGPRDRHVGPAGSGGRRKSASEPPPGLRGSPHDRTPPRPA